MAICDICLPAAALWDTLRCRYKSRLIDDISSHGQRCQRHHVDRADPGQAMIWYTGRMHSLTSCTSHGIGRRSERVAAAFLLCGNCCSHRHPDDRPPTAARQPPMRGRICADEQSDTAVAGERPDSGIRSSMRQRIPAAFANDADRVKSGLALRQCRSRLAERTDVPAYVICRRHLAARCWKSARKNTESLRHAG